MRTKELESSFKFVTKPIIVLGDIAFSAGEGALISIVLQKSGGAKKIDWKQVRRAAFYKMEQDRERKINVR